MQNNNNNDNDNDNDNDSTQYYQILSNKLLSKTIDSNLWRDIMKKPFEADLKIMVPNVDPHFAHDQYIYVCKDSLPKLINKHMKMENNIDCVYFIYNNKSDYEYDEKYWFLIGKIKTNISNHWFSYESGCPGTGFGLGTETTIFLVQQFDILIKYCLTDKQRNLIIKHIDDV